MTSLWDAYHKATKPFEAPTGEKCVHTEHCCIEHGCKYGDLDCPVWLGYKAQSYPCEECEGGTPYATKETIKDRRSYAYSM